MSTRLFATDLDGTLLRRDGTVSPRTRKALQAAEDAGLVVAFVTGRPPRWLDAVVEDTGHLGIAVGANGAVLYDLHTEQILSVHAIDVELVRTLARDLRAAFPAVTFAVEYADSFAAESDYVHDWQINPATDRRGVPVAPPLVGTIDEIAIRPALKLLAKDRQAQVDDFLRSAEAVLAGRGSITHSSRVGLLEIAAPGVTKASGLAELAERYGIAREDVIAIGDMPNDVPMLEWAGTSYAVGNAHPSAKAAADQIVGHNEDDAVAIVIESLLA
jgi:Cof subfamily protein (haloacid dehalogenase superfamily)